MVADPKPEALVIQRRRFLSPLMVRIMAVNVLALVVLVGGVLYLNQFRDDLIDSRVETMLTRARIIAGALGEAAVLGPEADQLDLAAAEQIVRRLVGPTDMRARLFSTSGALIADSRILGGEHRVEAEPLPLPDAIVPVWRQVETELLDLLESFTQRRSAPRDIERPGLSASDLLEVASALEGESMVQLRLREDGRYVINVAVPVQRFRRVLAGLMVTAQTEDIEAIVRAEEALILRIFAAALVVTLLLSFFLGRTLVRPIRRLAQAAERVRRNVGREKSLPAFSHRRDEIGDLSRSLSAMMRALYNQIDAGERFAADVAHELKNPLTSMRSALETLQRSDKPEIRQRLLAVLGDDVRRLDRLITDISEASRIDAELTRGHMEPVDLGNLLSALVQTYVATLEEDGVKIIFDSPKEGSHMVLGFEARLGQVWRNLVDNAISFSPKGGTVTLKLANRGRLVIVTVEDEGPGLPEGSVDKIFKRFYSERTDDRSFGRHSGLGLAIARQIVEAHGGRITAENRLDKAGAMAGARFIVSLPRGTK